MSTTRSAHPSTRTRSGRPPRQRHAQAKEHHARTQAAAGQSGKGGKTGTRRWSHEVMEKSDALDLEKGIFRNGSADEIAQSLKRSSLASRRRKGTPFQSAMSMLNFYINRAGKNLPKTQRTTLERAKKKLREAFGRTP
ncbi:DUF3175 domain-containing protein [Paraburkholderia kururiensis]|uniref:DUF3175 domain-containing protein n=1 Tax=Paraburkholderia kururiensis TaxID=984307 RepID=A0ABZ0WK32_9BURK|nr:DUF3175 domain-containing protein [Paraburkholderia kururiensis]WQD77656.1 DUF3175 domain-containing protein [Paraburkholderia kururiensis]